jgi:copper chaperone CopZ
MIFISLTVLTLIALSNCTSEGEIMQISFKVDGMSIRGGILWMGWPTDIGKALDGLKGIESHSFNIENRQFMVRYDSKVVDKTKIIKAVEDAGNFSVKNWEIIKY